MITSARMAVVDRNAEALGVPRRVLMESSGNAVARAVREAAHPGDRVVIVAGRGNNGGDAFVAARFLSEFDVQVRLVGHATRIRSSIARANWAALQAADISTTSIRDSSEVRSLEGADVIVDGLLGTGIAGEMREPAATVARRMNDVNATVISIDVPSGRDPDTGATPGVVVDADRVVTFHDMKPGLAELSCPVTVADIGIPRAASVFVGPGDLSVLSRDPDSHKGDNGEVLVIGGGPYTGAPALAGQAALRAGADLVRVACPDGVSDRVQGYSEDLIVRPLDGPVLVPGMVDDLITMAAEHHVTVLGPGLGDAEPTAAAVERFLEGVSGRVVVDADALRSVPPVETDATLICTPHRGELRAMGGPAEVDWRTGAESLQSFAAELGHVLVVKGRYDVITDGTDLRVNRTGNAAMTVGGTGDVLAGVIGALAALQQPMIAGSLGTYLNGRAGDIIAEKTGVGLLATDLLDAIPDARRDPSPEANQ